MFVLMYVLCFLEVVVCVKNACVHDASTAQTFTTLTLTLLIVLSRFFLRSAFRFSEH